MSFQITRGLFKLDFIDHHAVLGVPVDADGEAIRKRYMRIAKKLHPDSSALTNEEEKKLAAELLSKLVNPSKEKLSQEKERTEYALLLRLKGQQAMQQQDTIELSSELSRQLAQSNNIDATYKASLKQLADKQYEALNQVQDVTGEISELNLVYLMLKASKGEKINPNSPKKASTPTPGRPTAPPPPPPKVSPVEQYYRRAEELIEKQNLAQAILELRDALKLEPDNSACHSLLGEIYLKQNQSTMAKVHINQALKLNPKDQKALDAKKKLEQSMQKAAAKANTSKSSGGKSKKGDDGGITIFGIKIGGKKK